MFQFRGQDAAVPVKYFPDLKKVLLLASHQQDA
jgi:hypothetical protein